MNDFPPEELGKEIDRLWAKVGSSSAETWEPFAPVSEAPTTREVAWETVTLLKRQHTNETRYWAEVLEAKERTARAAQERVAFLELEVTRLREKIRAEQDRFISEGLDNQSKVEAAVKSLEERDTQEAALRDLLEQTRQRLAAEQARARQERDHADKRERQHVVDLKDLQALAARREEESGKAFDKAKRLEDGMAEAKNALEKTLSELLRERQVRAETEAERDKALKKVDELKKHFEELSKIWEEERAQWRELWDRERSTWETQRGEFSAWEEKLRQERETWLAEVKAKEQDQAVFTAKISESLKESSEATSRLSTFIDAAAAAAQAARQVQRKSAFAQVWRPALGVILAAAAVFGARRYVQTLHFKQQASRPVELSNPTAAAFDGNYLWVSEWNGKLLAFDPQGPVSPAKVVTAAPGGAYRPVALAFGGGNLWTLDAAQARVVRHKAEQPDKIAWSRPSPGPAPTALAFDGESLWSFDAANKTLYRHGSDEGTFKAFPLDREVVATAMAWAGGKLLIADAKTRKVLAFDLKAEGLKFSASYALGDSVVGLAAAGGAPRGRRKLYAVAGPGAERAGNAVIEFNY